jgi:hypothetical protein
MMMNHPTPRLSNRTLSFELMLLQLPPEEFRLAIFILNYRNEESGLCIPSLRTLQKHMGVNLYPTPMSISRLIGKLKKKKILETIIKLDPVKLTKASTQFCFLYDIKRLEKIVCHPDYPGNDNTKDDILTLLETKIVSNISLCKSPVSSQQPSQMKKKRYSLKLAAERV